MSEFGGDPLAIATVLIRPDTSKFRADLQAELTAATAAPVVVPVKAAVVSGTGAAATQSAITKGLRESTVATKTFTAATVVEASALQTAGTQTAKDTVEKTLNTAATRKAALAHEQFGRGAGTGILSLLGLRAATLASSEPFLIGATAVLTAKKAIGEYSKEAEAASRVNVIFGASAEELEKSARGLANSFGLSAAEALKFEGALGQVFQNVGVANEQNARLSEDLVKRAADVAARVNTPVEQVLRAFQLALSGNLRGLRQFVPGITAAEIAQVALANSGKKVVASLTTQELTLARAEVVLRDSANQAGAFADRQGNLAAQTKIAEANIANFAATVGGPVATTLTGFVFLLNKAAEGVQKLNSLTSSGGGTKGTLFTALKIGILAVVNPAAALDIGLIKLAQAIKGSGQASDATGVSFHSLAVQAGLTGVTVVNALAAINRSDLSAVNAQIDALQQNLLDLQFQGAGTGRIVANLQQQIAAARAVLANPASTPADKAAARRTRNAAQDQIKAINAQIVSDANAAVTAVNAVVASAQAQVTATLAAAKQAQADAQAQLDAQDQALITAQQLAQGQLDITKAKAALTPLLGDDLTASKKQLALINQQIVQAASIHDATTRLQRIQELELQAVQTEGEIAQQTVEAAKQRFAVRFAAAQLTATSEDDLRTQIAYSAALRKEIAAKSVTIKDLGLRKIVVDALNAELKASEQAEAGLQVTVKQQRRERAATILDLNIQIAQTKKSIAGEIAARKAKIAFDQEQLKTVHGDTVRAKQLQLDIETNRAALRELTKAKKDLSAEQIGFAFLTEQQGFAANLLSNLLPTSAVAGTVGGTSTAISTDTVGAAGFATAVHTRPPAPTGPGQAASTAAQVSQGAGGATAGQMNRLITLMTQLVGIVGGKKVAPRHPEATYQTYTSSTEMAHPLS